MANTLSSESISVAPYSRNRPVSELLLAGGISIASGEFSPSGKQWESEKLSQGLKVIIIESGEMLCRFPRQEEMRISGPAVCAVWDQDNLEAMQCFMPGCNLRYTAISLSLQTLTEHLPPEVSEQLSAGMCLDLSANARLRVDNKMPSSLNGLQAQLQACPMKGLARQLFLSGKALEIVAHSLDAMTASPQQARAVPLRIGSSDLERLHRVKEMLETRMDCPPSLEELSLRVGMNTRKLTMGFRRVFGESIYGYLQTLRLETAYRLLSGGEMSVSTVAYQIGYTPAHLSVAFKKRYGFTPKNLRG